jgi:hypothetical protein
MGGNIVPEAAQQNSTDVACLLWFITRSKYLLPPGKKQTGAAASKK